MVRFVETVFAYEGTAGQLSFGVSQLIEVITEGEPNEWWEGRIGAGVGWFPSAYCSAPFDEGIDTPQDEEGTPQAPAGPVMATALYAFEASSPDELSFAAGDKIEIISAEQTWWIGRKGKAEGCFPSNYVELASNEPEDEWGEDGHKAPRDVGELGKALGAALTKARGFGGSSREFDDEDGSEDTKEMTDEDINEIGFAEMPMAADGFAMGSRPMWKHPAFADMFVSAYSEQLGVLRRPPPLISLVMAIEVICKSLVYLSSECAPGTAAEKGVSAALKALEAAQDLVKIIPTTSVDDAAMATFLNQLMPKIRALRDGECMLIPVNLHSTDGNEAVLFSLRRKSKGFFSFAVVAAGPSLQYHAVSVDECTAEFRHNTAVVLESVPAERVTDSSFWFLLFRAQMGGALTSTQPSGYFTGWLNARRRAINTSNIAADGARFVYETLIPFLNSRPVTANVDMKKADFMPLPAGGDASAPSHLVTEAMRHVLRGCGFNKKLAAQVVMMVRWMLLRMAESDLRASAQLSPSDAEVLRAATRQLAASTAEEPPPRPLVDGLRRTVSEISERLSDLGADSAVGQDPAALPLPRSATSQGGTCIPFVGRLRRDTDVEHLAGDSQPRQILLPVQLTLVPEHVASFADAARALRRCEQLCSLLTNQQHLVRNSLYLRLALVQHTVVELLPLPLPRHHSDCFWRRETMRYESQSDLMRLLLRLSRQYMAACLGVQINASLDAARCVTLGAIACIADAVLRAEVIDTPSVFAMHYSGRAGGPTSAFGFSLSPFETELDQAPLYNPTLVGARVQILDYIQDLHSELRADHVIFQFERSMRPQKSDLALLKQLCLATAHPPFQLPQYLTGSSPALIDAFPELAALRDIVFSMKMLMSPAIDTLPSVMNWSPSQAVMSWTVDDDGVFQVAAFGATLRCAAYILPEGADKTEKRTGAIRLFGGHGGGNDKVHVPRMMPSWSSPSNLLGQAVASEDDILHAKSLPEFGIRMRPHESELLLQYLTVPYLRIPLVLRFFADRSRIKALISPQLQAVLDATLFEPSAWKRSDHPQMPDVVPFPDRLQLSTPAGLLIQELRCSPNVLVSALDLYLEFVLEMDVGRYVPSSSPIVLYVLRLLARVDGYVRLVLSDPPTARGIGGYNHHTKAKTMLDEAWSRVCAVLNSRAVPMLKTWCMRAVKEQNLPLACGLHAHLVLLHKNLSYDELDTDAVSTLLGAQVFMNINNHPPPPSPEINRALPTELPGLMGVLMTELFDTFQKLRWPLLRWLQDHKAECDTVMEHIVQTITLSYEHSDMPRARARALRARQWASLEEPGHIGRFVPDTELSAQENAAERLQAAQTYEEFLRAQTQTVDTEVNVQLGEYTLKNNTLQPLTPSIAASPDFVSVFGVSRNANPIQCVEVLNSTRRKWLRLVGQRHDVQLWDAEPRKPDAPFDRLYMDPSREDAPMPTDRSRGTSTAIGLTQGESWIQTVLEPFRKQYLHNTQLFLPEYDHTNEFIAYLGGTMNSDSGAVLKEVVVFRQPPVVHVYNVVSHARRFYRTLVFSSDNAFCLHDMPCTLFLHGERPKFVAGDPRTPAPAASSLLITRSLNKSLGTQTYIPSRLLRGQLPAALLENYAFWQNEDDSLTAYPRPFVPQALRSTRLQLTLYPQGDPDQSGYGGAQAVLTLRREAILLEHDAHEAAGDGDPTMSGSAIPPLKKSVSSVFESTGAAPPPPSVQDALPSAKIKEQQSWITATAPVDQSKPAQTLVNLLHAPPSSSLRQLSALLMRLEYLSHVLVWSETLDVGPADDCAVTLIELPRLRLSFRVMQEGGSVRLDCVEHAGLHVTTRSDERTRGLLRGLPHSLLLENGQGELFVLVSATTLPQRPALKAAIFSTEVVLDRSNHDWLSNVGNAPAYLYPVHVGRLSLSWPTFAAGVYLLLLRFLARQYHAVFRMASCCVSDMPLSGDEQQIFEQLGSLAHDTHPDAHACRLKISLVTRSTAHGDLASTKLWTLRDEYAAYVSKARYVSTVCRLSIAEELLLLTMVDTDQSAALYNRRMFVRTVSNAAKDVAAPPITLRYPPQPQLASFDAFGEHLQLGNQAATEEQWWSRFSSLSYTRPDETLGAATINAINKWLDRGLSLAGGKDGLGFLFFYEMMSGSLSLKILSSDSPYILGSLLLRMLPSKEFKRKDQLMSILRILAHNRSLAADMPRFQDTRKFKLSSKVLKSSDMLKNLFTGIRDFLLKNQASIRWPRQRLPHKSPAMLQMKSMTELLASSRRWLSAHVFDFASEKRALGPVSFGEANFSAKDIEAFAGCPLSLSHFVVVKPKPPLGKSGAALVDVLPNVEAHGAADNPMAAAMLARLREDLGQYGQVSQQGFETHLGKISVTEASAIVDQPAGPAANAGRQAVEEISRALERRIADDRKLLLIGMNESEKLANVGSEIFLLAQHANTEATITFEMLVGMLVCAHGDDTLKMLNPSLDGQQLEKLFNLVTCTMLVAARIGHASRCHGAARKVTGILHTLDAIASSRDAKKQELAQQASAFAELVNAKRCYMNTAGADAPPGSSVTFDPRLLSFEYAHDLLLRSQQERLVHEFRCAAHAGESRVHQMIMGAGKTTVVAPLLALMLGNNQTLVMQVVPPALLEFSRSVMRQRFSSILRKPVYTFNFDRFTAASPELLSKMVQARQLSAVMITSPTSLKSFMLKFVEVVHMLEQSNSDEEDFLSSHNAANGMFRMMQPGRGVPMFRRTRSEEVVVSRASLVPQLMAQAKVTVSVVKELQASLLMLDEVDLILHPLKSELNWPLGKRKPLDFGASRWAVPFHLLDALFYCSDGKVPDAWHDNGTAINILERLRAAVEIGMRSKVLQKTPHFVLISRPFYRTSLKPLLCRWMLLWLRKNRLRELKDERVLAYLMYGARSHNELTNEMKTILTDKHVKMMNLSHIWLEQLLPHVLSKTNRVSYGLLAANQCTRETPTTRRLLAVPFLGKDVPSPASEFAHPDVVIGFTILAYRHEGMRMSDFKKVIRDQLDVLDLQSGPVEDRPAYLTYKKWVQLAGGRVRGTRLDPGAPPPALEFSEIWPLHLLDVADTEQLDLLLRLLARLPQLVEHYLSNFIFPQTMLHQTVKLSATAQELGGDLIFKVRLGFSGTPSDLLPLELGRCHYAMGDDARMLHVLTSTEHVTYEPLPNEWSVLDLLDQIAASSFNALIDTGALITGMTNLQVAQHLLQRGLPHFDAVVFLDAQDRKMTLLRHGFKVVELAECGVALERRFSFYDQVHTTGMDIEQPLNAHAVLTLGKDMVFRDYAQGAYRLRKIGAGQQLTLFIIPEVMQLVGSHMARCHKLTVGQYAAWFCALSAFEQHSQMLRDVVLWLIINSMILEQTQFKLLCEQNLTSVWRKRAYRNLLAGWESLVASPNAPQRSDAPPPPPFAGASVLKQSVGVFREGIDFSIENTVPGQEDYMQRLTQRVADNHELCEEPEERAAIDHVMRLVAAADFGKVRTKKKKTKVAGGKSPEVKARAIFEYQPMYDGDLALVEGDVISVTSQNENGWWEGEVNKRRGRFPGNFVVLLDEDTDVAAVGDETQEEEPELVTEQVQEQEQEQEQEEEQQKEQQVEQEVENIPEPPQEPARQKYSRDDERVVAWPLSALDRQPEGGNHGFNSWSEFKVYNQAAVSKSDSAPHIGLAFPPAMLLTTNVYKHRHAEHPRRLKNVVVVMEWFPDGPNRALTNSAGMSKLPPVPLEQLGAVYQQLGGTDDVGIPLQHLWDLWRNMALPVDDPDEQLRLQQVLVAAQVAPHEHATVSFEQLCHLMHPTTLQPVVRGRFFIVLSLAEAESMRCILHSRGDATLSDCGSPSTVALHLLDSTGGITMLECSSGHEHTPDGEFRTVHQCLRFIDSSMEYNSQELTFLLRGLQDNECSAREIFFGAVCAGRRRVQHGWGSRSVTKVFSLAHELCVLRQFAIISRVRSLLIHRQIFLLDAFRAFNAAQNGLLSCSELYGALVWLGLQVVPNDIHAMVRFMDIDGDGLISFDEFRRAFGSGDEDEDWADELEDDDSVRNGQFTNLKPIPMRELTDADEEIIEKQVMELPPGLLEQFKCKVQKLEKFDEVWRSAGIASKEKVSIWDGKLSSKKLGATMRNRRRVCLGHFASGSFHAPRGDRYVLELTDMSVSGMQQSKWVDAVVRQHFPHPIRFHRAWSILTGSSPLYIWQPVPPSSEFVAMGMIATKTEETPSVRSIHCVPRAWVDPAPEQVKMLWSDSGAGGKSGSVWSVGSLQLLAASAGQKPPTEFGFNMKQTRFTLGDSGMRLFDRPRASSGGSNEYNRATSIPSPPPTGSTATSGKSSFLSFKPTDPKNLSHHRRASEKAADSAVRGLQNTTL